MVLSSMGSVKTTRLASWDKLPVVVPLNQDQSYSTADVMVALGDPALHVASWCPLYGVPQGGWKGQSLV